MNTSNEPRLLPAEIKDWRAYYRMTDGRAPTKLAIEATRMLDFRGNALELGCGTCIEVRHFLEEGIARVDGVDFCQFSSVFASGIRDEFGPYRFQFFQTLFSEFEFKANTYDLVFSDASLPWHGQEGILQLIHNIKLSLRDSGVFAASFLGKEHWVNKKYPELAYFSREELSDIFSDMETIIEEENRKENLGICQRFIVKAKKSDDRL